MHLHGPQFRLLSPAGGSTNALREGIFPSKDPVVLLVLGLELGTGEMIQVSGALNGYFASMLFGLLSLHVRHGERARRDFIAATLEARDDGRASAP